VAPSATLAAGPAITITDPAPDSTVLVGARFRLGWSESAPSSAPIIGRNIVQYSGPVPENGNCAKASYAIAWTNTSANPPRRLPLSGLAAGTCYYWTVTLTDVNGVSASARSGYLLGAPAVDPGVSFTFPAAGAYGDGPPSSYTVTWSETAAAGVASRSVTEEAAPMAADRTCDRVSWAAARTFRPTGAWLAVGGLTGGTCYRYSVAIRDADGRSAASRSGPLLITTVPPTCAYGDVLTTFGAYADWSRTLLDPIYRLPSTYAPTDLVYTTGIYHVSGAFRIRSLAYTDLKALADAARAAGAAIDLTSTYRTYSQQKAIYDYYVSALGPTGGLLRAARPGHSEHQLGTTIDVKAYNGVSPSNYADWTVTKAGAWMRDNAWKYGWMMSYPKATSPATTCYQSEPWHYRYVGRTVAKAAHDAGLTLRETSGAAPSPRGPEAGQDPDLGR